MNCPTLLKFWQPVAIAAIIEIRDKTYLSGAVLGDPVGLGKTWEAVGVILHVSNPSPRKRLSQTDHIQDLGEIQRPSHPNPAGSNTRAKGETVLNCCATGSPDEARRLP
ncbi:hypothetical protein MW887_010743 [Aspergillus wentii]|nr:hypothetical protein MW887_010743 [Aspergillus wentii]